MNKINTPIKDGGPAFPIIYCSEGVTLRDWFAGQALSRATIGAGGSAPAIAARAYFIADAMLAARNKGAT